jgi:hypothetical protein
VPAVIAAALLLAAVAITWPLAAELNRSLPGDYGDPVFVTWVMAWVNGQLTAGTFEGFWTANIFFPEHTTLAFSEHFVAQSVMVWPVYVISGNPILSYNIAFLLTFVLTGLGTFLLTRAVTGSVVAANLAAFIAAFNEYRLVYEVAHLHTLSIHFLPFALYALHRYLATDRRRYLAGAVASLVALNLSSIYYMAYSAPLIAVFVLLELIRFARWRSVRVWLELWAAAAFVLVATSPFLLPYINVQQRLGVARSLDELIAYSATLDHYRLALPGLALSLGLAAIAIIAAVAERSVRWITATMLVLVALAFWLSLGPVPHSGGQALGWPGLYAALHHTLPGYSGLRVPARFAMLLFVFLAVLAALGIAAIERRRRTVGLAVSLVAIAVVVGQAWPGTFPLNQTLPSEGLRNPAPAYLTPTPDLPLIYQAVDSLGPGAVLAELPFGDPWYDLRYMYFSATHRRRLLNGYSGLFPPSFLARQRVLARPLLDPGGSAQALAGATHVVVHHAAWTDDTGARVSAWLEQFGATLIAEAGSAALYELPVRENYALVPSFPSPPLGRLRYRRRLRE